MRRYYEEFSVLNAPRALKKTLREAMPTFHVPGYTAESTRSEGTGLKQFGEWALDRALWLVGGSRADLVAFFRDPCPGDTCVAANRWTMTFLVESMTFCDLESVTFCSGYQRDLWTSVVLAVLLYAALYAIAEAAGVGWLGAAVFYLIPLFALWFSIGVSPRCLPMVPTCMLDAVVDAAKAALPLSTEIPALLRAGNGTSVRSCEGLGLDGWQDPLLFALCDAGLCEGWDHVTSVGGVAMDVAGKRAMQASADAAAYRVCAGVMAVNTAGAAAIGVVGTAVASGLAWVLASTSAPLASLLWHVIVYDHE
jgi:hypothetical protein